jgi:hypothetical protein
VSTTFVCVLSCELCNSVTDLAPHRGVGLVGETLQQLCADGFTLGGLEGQEQICRLARGCLAWLGRLAPEDDGGESSSLWYRVSMARGLRRIEGRAAYRRVLGQLYLLREAHEQDIWALRHFLVELLLGVGALHIVGRLEALQEACEGAVDVFGENRHGGRRRCVVWARPVNRQTRWFGVLCRQGIRGLRVGGVLVRARSAPAW